MDLLPRKSVSRQIQPTKRRIPVEEIIAVQGHNPIAAGIDSASASIGAALMKRAELRRQGEMLAQQHANDLQIASLKLNAAAGQEAYDRDLKERQEAYDRDLKERQFKLEQEKVAIARDKKIAEEKARIEKEQSIASGLQNRAGLAVEKVDQALGNVNWASAGGMAETRKLPVIGPFIGQLTGATDLEADLETVKALLGFEQLEQMKSQSKAGSSGLGALSDRELRLLTAARASLEQSQSPEQLRTRLGEVKTHYQNWQAMEQGINPYKSNGLKSITPKPAMAIPVLTGKKRTLAEKLGL